MNRKKHKLMAAVAYMESFGERQSDPDVWRRLNRVLVLGIGLLVAAYLAGAFWPQIEHLREVERQVERLGVQVAALETRRDQVQREHDWLTNDPTYLEVRARDRLNLKKPGEKIYQVRSAGGGAAPVK